MMMLNLPSGSPTAELFVASYNNTRKSKTITLEPGDYGYMTTDDAAGLNIEDNHGIYNANSTDWWLSSPGNHAYDPAGLLFACVSNTQYPGYVATGYADYHSFAVRPIVCIPTTSFNSKYGTDTSLVNQ